jgi:hypothetical protein
MTEERGRLVITSADGRYRFVDPLQHTYAKAVLRPIETDRGATFTIDAIISWDTRAVFTEVFDMSRDWSGLGHKQVYLGTAPPQLEIKRRRTRPAPE